jgi:N-acetylglucosaminyl-diphospho-decaprenol L-rhamnosyltransferase
MTPDSREVPVTVIIVTFASQDVVGRTLSALASGHASGLLDCLVVDNASPDRTREVMTSDHPWVRMIASPKNLGYGRACNLGFNEVTTPYVLFMNPDVEIQPAGVARLLHHLEERPRAGIIAPATRIGGEYQSAGGLPTPWSIARNAMGGVGALAGAGPILPGMAPYSTDWLCGAVMLVRSAMFRAIGGFDPTFFLYFEETDLCARMLQAGFELWATGDVEAVHTGGMSSKKLDPALRDGIYVVEHFFASQYYYLKKHHGAVAAAAVETTELSCKALRDVGRAVLRRPSKHELRTRLRGPIFACPPAVT